MNYSNTTQPQATVDISSSADNIYFVIADTPELLKRVYEFRYKIYIEMLKRPQHYADHDSKCIREPLDDCGNIFAAIHNDNIVGTIRYNWADDPETKRYQEYYRMDEISGIERERCTITTKLMIDPLFSSRLLGVKIACFTFLHIIKHGGLLDFIDCNPPREHYFKRLGYRFLFPRFEHDEYGMVTPMILINHDIEHNRNVRSPLAREIKSENTHPAWVQSVQQTLSNSFPHT